jgi:hypothetical protein
MSTKPETNDRTCSECDAKINKDNLGAMGDQGCNKCTDRETEPHLENYEENLKGGKRKTKRRRTKRKKTKKKKTKKRRTKKRKTKKRKGHK